VLNPQGRFYPENMLSRRSPHQMEDWIMPHLIWVHNCSDRDGSKVWLGEEICRTCGVQGEPDGMGLTGIEARGNFQRLTGLPSIGPHMPRLPKYSERCPACEGDGIRVIYQHKRWVPCRTCQGTGGIITVNEKKFIEIQKEAWALFDTLSLERVGESRKHEIQERQRTRTYKGIYKRDHYVQKRSKRIVRYFEKFNRLMSLMVDPESCSPEEIQEWENLKCPKN